MLGSFSLPWINLIFVLHNNGWLHEQLKEEQLGYKLGFNLPQTSFATVWKLLRYKEHWFVCKLGKKFLSCLIVVLGPNANFSIFFNRLLLCHPDICSSRASFVYSLKQTSLLLQRYYRTIWRC